MLDSALKLHNEVVQYKGKGHPNFTLKTFPTDSCNSPNVQSCTIF